MAHICNRLEKLVPPPFLTVKTEQSKPALLKWSKLQRISTYCREAGLLSAEISFLNGFIIRKGTQLRLEKALLLTTQVLKISQRWKDNQLLSQLTQFGLGMGKTSIKQGKGVRLPSKQWCTWILYLILREAALIAKLKVECENTTQYWLGMISCGHHWGDSLVITAILSRIWHISSLILEEIIDTSYPAILNIHSLLESTNSSKWPEEDFQFPDHIYSWLRNTMKLTFERARININLSFLNKAQTSGNGSAAFKILSKSFISLTKKEERTEIEIQQSPGSTNAVEKENESKEFEKPEDNLFFIDTKGSNFVQFATEAEEEDLGIVISEEPSKMSKNSKLLEKLRLNPRNEPLFVKYWSPLTEWAKPKGMSNPKKRKKLLSKLKNYKNNENDGCSKIRLKLVKLIKLTRKNLKDKSCSIKCLRKHLNKFNSYINSRAVKLKTE